MQKPACKMNRAADYKDNLPLEGCLILRSGKHLFDDNSGRDKVILIQQVVAERAAALDK